MGLLRGTCSHCGGPAVFRRYLMRGLVDPITVITCLNCDRIKCWNCRGPVPAKASGCLTCRADISPRVDWLPVLQRELDAWA